MLVLWRTGDMRLTMKEKKSLTNQVASRYRGASKEEKRKILDEFVSNTAYNRKYAITVLNGWGRQITTKIDGKVVKIKGGNSKRAKGGGRKPTYTQQTIESLFLIWMFFDKRCSKVLIAFIRNEIHHLKAHPAFGVTEEVERQLLSISSSTVDRRLRSKRLNMQLLPKRSHTKRGPMLKSQIPVRVYWPIEDQVAGYFEIDTVHHCAETTYGEYCLTLTAVDVSSGWVYIRPLRNKARRWVLERLEELQHTHPFPLCGIDSDSGSEFINDWIVNWASQNNIHFTRGRSCHKNDNCYVEQKNDTCVRQYVGYLRYDTQQEYEALEELYEVLCPLLNYFIPTAKLISKERHTATIKKLYEQPNKTPYQRLLTDSTLSDEIKQRLTAIYLCLNPIELQARVNEALVKLDSAYSNKLQNGAGKRIASG